MKKLILSLCLFLLSTGIVSATDVYLTTITYKGEPVQVYIDDASIIQISNNHYVFSSALVRSATGKSRRYDLALGSFFNPYDVLYINGTPNYVSELDEGDRQLVKAYIAYLQTHEPSFSY